MLHSSSRISPLPAVLPGLAAVAGPAESAAGRPAHVRPEACLLLEGRAVQAVRGVDEAEALHEGPRLEQSRLRAPDGPESRREVGDDLDGVQEVGDEETVPGACSHRRLC